MAWGIKKTEHAGAKKGTGAFYGRKANAKHGSSRKRRQNSKITINAEFRNDRNSEYSLLSSCRSPSLSHQWNRTNY